MLPPHSDHQSERLLHGLFLCCVSRGLLGFSHEDIIDFDICAHGPYRVYRRMILYTFEPRCGCQKHSRKSLGLVSARPPTWKFVTES
jgi:hypothetical protein